MSALPLESMQRKTSRPQLRCATFTLVVLCVALGFASQGYAVTFEQITDFGRVYDPTWSPDGSTIAFVRDGDIWTVAAAGGGASPLFSDPAADTEPCWSPDGMHLAFQSNRNGNADIWLIGASGQGLEQVTSSSFADVHPTWSPDGERMAFTSYRDGSSDIWVIDLASGSEWNLTNHDGDGGTHPAWSPDGQWIAFTAARSGWGCPWPCLFVADAVDAYPIYSVSDGGYAFGPPSWSPNSMYVAYDSILGTYKGGCDVYYRVLVTTFPGEGTVQVTPLCEEGEEIYHHSPSWSPDGTRLVVVSNREQLECETFGCGEPDLWIVSDLPDFIGPVSLDKISWGAMKAKYR